MIILISGATHTGKTRLAQHLLEKYHYPYLSIDHLKMGLIRSGNADLTPADDEKLTEYLWPVVREMIKTAIENNQNLVVEGCYIPFTWADDFDGNYLPHIRYCCLIFSRGYVESHFDMIREFACTVERRLDDSGLCMEELVQDNERNLQQCLEHHCDYVLISHSYPTELSGFLSVRTASFEDMALATHIMITSFHSAFADFVTPETMAACTNPANCRAMLEAVYREGRTHFLLCAEKAFLCWTDRAGQTELIALHSLPESWGTGLGHVLLTEALRQIGSCPVFLWAFKDNTRARRFYEKHGFRWDGTERISQFDGALEVRYVKP